MGPRRTAVIKHEEAKKFLAAIDENPCDQAPRLVYADWLDENGYEDEAAEMRESAAGCDLASTLKGMFDPGDRIDKAHLKVEGHGRAAAQLVWGKMYDAPGVTFDLLKALSDLFGTTHIDVDDYAEGGCETCDWGSDYGHTIQVYEPTRNAAELKALVGTEIWPDRR
jgi:uncharacterized protein (TIGR02996 family)